MKFPKYISKADLKIESDAVLTQKVEALLAVMTEEEILNLCHGHNNPEGMQVANAGYNPGIPRLGVPEIRMYDGPAGVTSVYETTGLPVQEMLAAAWDPKLAYDYGKVEGSENYAISGNTQLGSQFDVVRTPQFGRNKDMLGEDPFLTTALAVLETRGIQDAGAVATLKHFGVASIGTDMQNAADQIVDEQTLHEIVFPPFEAAAKLGRAGSFMCCYNKFNGSYASANEYAQKTVLREMWGYKGYMMSDWGANHALTTGKGMDMEMPNGAYNSNERILRGIQKGRLTWQDVENAARHVLYGFGMAGYLGLVQLDKDGRVLVEEGRTEPIRMMDRYTESVLNGLLDENADICREVARKGAVLLKNENKALPLTQADYTGDNSVALIGLGGKYLLSGAGQERSYGRISRMKSPETELKRLVGDDSNIHAEITMDFFGTTIPGTAFYQDAECAKPGLIRTYGVSEPAEIPPFLAAMIAGKEGEPPQAMGGGGVEFHGVASAEEDEDADVKAFGPTWSNSLDVAMEGHDTGSFCCVDETIDFTCGTSDGGINQNYKNAGDGTAFIKGEGYTWNGYLRVPETGNYALILQAIGGNTALKLDLGKGYETIGSTELREGAQWPWGSLVATPEGMEVHGRTVHLEAGQAYPIRLCVSATIRQKDLQVRLAWITPEKRQADCTAALKAAKQASKVLFFLSDSYLHPEGSSSGGFPGMAALPSMAVPKEQMELLRNIKAVMRPDAQLIVLHNNGQLYALGEVADMADALLNIWTPGQEGGQVVAELLLGLVNPSGKMAITVPAKETDTLVTDTPEHTITRYQGYEKDGKKYIDFDEGIFCGYRWYDITGVTPLYAFGHGLSYTSFAYSDLQVQGRDVTFTVTNTGTVPGTEIAQVYLGAATVPEHIQMAQKQLCGFIRLDDLQPGEGKTVTIKVSERSLSYWDKDIPLQQRPDGTRDKWVLATGTRPLYVGGASDNLPLSSTITV